MEKKLVLLNTNSCSNNIRNSSGLCNYLRERCFSLFIIVLSVILINFVSSFEGGDGSVLSPYQISNCTQLQEVENNLTASYILINNIDCSETINWNNGSGFDAIGSDIDNFSGNFDGQNLEIQNLFFNFSIVGGGNYVGLIAFSTGNIKNINIKNIILKSTYGSYISGVVANNYGNITNVTVNGEISGSNYVAGVASSNEGIIKNVTNYAIITGSEDYVAGISSWSSNKIVGSSNYGLITGDGIYVGGIVGLNDEYVSSGNVTNCSNYGNILGIDYVGGISGRNEAVANIVDNCYNEGNVSESSGNVEGNTGDVGGIVGYNKGNISNCYNKGNINSTTDAGGISAYNLGSILNSYSKGDIYGYSYVGGLVGYSGGGIIKNSYSTGKVNGTSVIGGLVASLDGTFENVQILNSYSSGNVNGETSFGGLIGELLGELYDISNSFWDNQTSNQTTSAGGIGKNTTQMKDISTFSLWDIVDYNSFSGQTWFILDDMMYPKLTSQYKSVEYSGYNYQEFANSTLCAGDWDIVTGTCSSIYDGDWNTFSSFYTQGIEAWGYYYANYTKPYRANNLTLWQKRDTYLVSENLTVPSSCWNYNSQKLILRLQIFRQYFTNSYWSCYNGNWLELDSSFGSPYEEAIYWNTGTKINLSSPANFQSTVNPLEFNCSATSYNNADNLEGAKLLIWNSSGVLIKNISKSISGFSNNTFFNNITIDDEGTYYWNCMVTDENGLTSINNKNNTFFLSISSPAVNLVYPTSNYYSNKSLIFNFTAEDVFNVTSCKLYTNRSGWNANYTWNSITEGQITSSPEISFEEGVYKWNVECNNSGGVAGFAQSNYTFIMDSIKPRITFYNVTTVEGSQTVTTNLNVSDINIDNSKCYYSVLNSSGGADGLLDNISFTCSNLAILSFAVSAYSTYTLEIYATDLAGNTNHTAVNFTTSETVIPLSTGGGGGGGSSSSSVIALKDIGQIYLDIVQTETLTVLQRAILYSLISIQCPSGECNLNEAGKQELLEKVKNAGIDFTLQELEPWLTAFNDQQFDEVELSKTLVDKFNLSTQRIIIDSVFKVNPRIMNNYAVVCLPSEKGYSYNVKASKLFQNCNATKGDFSCEVSPDKSTVTLRYEFNNSDFFIENILGEVRYVSVDEEVDYTKIQYLNVINICKEVNIGKAKIPAYFFIIFIFITVSGTGIYLFMKKGKLKKLKFLNI